MERTHLAGKLSFGRRLGVERLEIRVAPGELGFLVTAAWLGWGEELYAAGITISDFEVAFAEVKAAAQAENPSLAWLDDVPTKVATVENVVYDGQPVTAHDWVFEQLELADIGVELEPQTMTDQFMELLAKAVDLAMATGGSLAGVSPAFETEEGSTVASSDGSTDDSTDSSTILSCPPFCPPPNQAPKANDDGLYDLAWNQAFTMPDTRTTNILANDVDTDGPQPMQAFEVSDPSNGTVTVTINGGFTYTPDTGFYGMDSFTYKVNDGLADSNVATVSIRVIGINLSISDGQSGSGLPEEPAPNNETSRGAYTVANSNDTDADGIMDGGDLEVVATPGGQPEKDLMEVWVFPPTYVPPGTNPTVSVTWSGITL